MDSHIGEKEIKTQKRLIQLFEKRLGYTFLGDWKDRENSCNVEEKWLKKYLRKKNYPETEINKAIIRFKREANDLSDKLYQANMRVYNLLRYGVNILPEVGEQKNMFTLSTGKIHSKMISISPKKLLLKVARKPQNVPIWLSM